VKIFLLGAAGNAGQRILRAALARAHEVTAMVRDEAKLPSSPNLRVTRGIVDKSPDLARVMVGHDVVINAAGNVAEASAFTKLVQTVIDATTASLGEDGRLWVFGGAALLTVPGTRLMAVDLPRVPRVYEAHRTNLAALLRSRLDWSMLCPGPMIASENGKPTPNLRLATDEWPMARPTYTYVLPIRLALALAFKQKVPELTITYEDAAEVILDNLSKGGRFSFSGLLTQRRSLDRRADRDGYFGGVIVPPLRFWCGARRYTHLTHLDCAVGVPFLWCCYR
jgi:putative NADH-flavin reductase